MRACTCRGAAARKRTNSSPFSGSCLEFLAALSMLCSYLSNTISRNSSESIRHHWMGFTKYGNEMRGGRDMHNVGACSFLFCLAHTMYAVLRSRHRNPGCFFYPLSNLYSYELRATMLQDLCAVRDNTRDNYWKAHHLRPSQSPRALS